MSADAREVWIIEREVKPKDWRPITWLGPLLNEHDAKNACQVVKLNPAIKDDCRVQRYVPASDK